MFCLTGAQALSDFRLQRLLRQIQTIESSVTRVDARYLYFVQQDAAEPSDRLLAILNAQGLASEELIKQSINVVPRLGTRSAWSSKATDIANRCGMSEVKRIERGIAYHLHRCAGPTQQKQRASTLN